MKWGSKAQALPTRLGASLQIRLGYRSSPVSPCRAAPVISVLRLWSPPSWPYPSGSGSALIVSNSLQSKIRPACSSQCPTYGEGVDNHSSNKKWQPHHPKSRHGVSEFRRRRRRDVWSRMKHPTHRKHRGYCKWPPQHDGTPRNAPPDLERPQKCKVYPLHVELPIVFYCMEGVASLRNGRDGDISSLCRLLDPLLPVAIGRIPAGQHAIRFCVPERWEMRPYLPRSSIQPSRLRTAPKWTLSIQQP